MSDISGGWNVATAAAAVRERELRAEIERLRVALQGLINDVGGHDHWDREGTHGANCPICIRQWEAKENARRALAREGE